MQSPSSGSWRYTQIPQKTIITDGLKGLFISIGVGLTTATFLFATTLALTLIAGAANAEELNDLQKTSSGTLLVKNAQTGEYTPTPTLATEVEIDVSGMLSRTKVSQKFQNNSKDWVEGIYVFPLPDNAAVDRLRMRIGSRIIEGQIKEKKVAKKMFQEAKKSGKKATLVEQERSNIFTTTLTNIAPGESITVEIEYQNTLDYREGIVRLRFPLVVAPRYISDREYEALNTPQKIRNNTEDANRISPPVIDESEPKRNFVNLSINLDAGFTIANIQSTNHDIRKHKITDRKYTIQLASGSVPADRDFEVTWRSAPNAMPSSAVYTEIKRDKHFSLITLFPPTVQTEPDVRLPRDVVFVVDTSGSMHGSSLDQAKSALTMAVRRLTKNDRFNIIQFDDQTKALFDRERPASNKNLKVACQYIDALTADGGTEFAPALSMALNDEVKTGRIRQIVFITDGSIGNEDQIF
ncbi:VIT domain-containing protein, partial [Burkholderiales bacterium]|nr:VIT domain-containing protein [Burkholderiales bacterium]